MYPHFIAPGEAYQEYARRVAAADRKYQRTLVLQGHDPEFATQPRGRVWQWLRACVTAVRMRRPA